MAFSLPHNWSAIPWPLVREWTHALRVGSFARRPARSRSPARPPRLPGAGRRGAPADLRRSAARGYPAAERTHADERARPEPNDSRGRPRPAPSRRLRGDPPRFGKRRGSPPGTGGPHAVAGRPDPEPRARRRRRPDVCRPARRRWVVRGLRTGPGRPAPSPGHGRVQPARHPRGPHRHRRVVHRSWPADRGRPGHRHLRCPRRPVRHSSRPARGRRPRDVRDADLPERPGRRAALVTACRRVPDRAHRLGPRGAAGGFAPERASAGLPHPRLPEPHRPAHGRRDPARPSGPDAAAGRHPRPGSTRPSSSSGIDGPPPAPFATHSDTAITLGSAAKAWWGGLRVGWVRSPLADAAAIVEARHSLDLGTSVLEQLVVVELLRAGDAPARRATRRHPRAARGHGRSAAPDTYPTGASTCHRAGLNPLVRAAGRPGATSSSGPARRPA